MESNVCRAKVDRRTLEEGIRLEEHDLLLDMSSVESVVSSPLSVAKTVNGCWQLTTDHGQRTTDNGQRTEMIRLPLIDESQSDAKPAQWRSLDEYFESAELRGQ